MFFFNLNVFNVILTTENFPKLRKQIAVSTVFKQDWKSVLTGVHKSSKGDLRPTFYARSI
jgi:hypothetical protein